MKTLKLRNSIDRSALQHALLFIALILIWLAFSLTAEAGNGKGPPVFPTPTPSPTPTPTPTPSPTPTPTPAGENLGNGNTAAENVDALISLTTGINNTATGWQSLFSNTEGVYNTANGFQTLFTNATGHSNTANGYAALYSNTDSDANTATGSLALYSNTTGSGYNTANGYAALYSNTDGDANMATGSLALYSNTTGSNNTASGNSALRYNTTGSLNTALGAGAGFNVTTADNVIAIGALGANVSYSCFIGNIRGVTTANANATPVVIDTAGQLGTVSSSRRFKKEIKPMDQTSEAILALQPVTFHYKSDKTNTPQFGLIAEEAAAVNPDLVVRDVNGEIYSVRYDAVNAMLLNEFLKEHRKVEEQQATISQLKRGMETVVARLKEQDSKIQKVSDQLEASKPTPQMAQNNQ
jgi:hypothetical protein